jgi:acetyltransferase-like isoleucine patch superfamily enzyme
LRVLIRIIHSLIESAIRNISGGLGQRIRYQYYRRRFRYCGQNVRIDEGVIIHHPENISVGNDVWFLPYSMVTARPKFESFDERIFTAKENPSFQKEKGAITIGDQVSIGAYNIIQGYGGLDIGPRVTTSARVSIYSFSHVPTDPKDPSRVTYANAMVKSDAISCIESPIVIREGVWLGLNVIVFGGTIGKNSFVKTNSIVLRDLPDNSYASGDPAVKIKERFLSVE